MSDSKSVQQNKSGGLRAVAGKLLFAAAAVATIVVIFNHLSTFWYVLLTALGFGAVIMIHEFGHFIVAKVSGIKVEAFSIGFPPTLLGIQKTADGIRLRILPKFFKGNVAEGGDAESEGGLVCTLGKGGGKASDTEYRIGIVPFGGFVKMLGQEDTGAAEKTDDPGSYLNKPIIVRIAVVAAGVIFNAVSAFLIFMIVFLVGMDLSPAVVGGVQLNSPADRAGIMPGDRIVEVNGEKFVDFTNVVLAPALSARGEEISFVVEKPGGTRRSVKVLAEKAVLAAIPVRSLGIDRASSLTIEPGIRDPEDIRDLEENTGLRPGDAATAVDGKPVESHWQLEELIRESLMPQATVAFERVDAVTDDKTTVNVDIELYWPAHRGNFQTEFDLSHVFTMVPRIKIMAVVDKPKQKVWREKIKSFFTKDKGEAEAEEPKLRADDIIVKIGETENPTYEELRTVTTEYENKDMPITVLRTDEAGGEQEVVVTVVPTRPPRTDRVMFGVVPALDAEHAIVANTIDAEGGPKALAIPRGATITAIGGEKVASFYDVVRIIRANRGRKISLEYTGADGSGQVDLAIDADNDHIAAISQTEIILPFQYLKKNYKASGPIEAISWGVKKTYMFIAQTYVTLQRLVTRDVSPRALSGPVGIVSMSYKIASQSIADYIYFLGLISSCIAVMNLLPLPIVDGGVIVLLIIEKIKGGPINPKLQEGISYAGLALLGAVFLWLTYNDILNLFLH